MSKMQEMRETPRRPNEIDLVSRWSLAVLVIVVLLSVAYSTIYYVAQIDDTRTRLVAGLPANYRDTIQAMVRSTGATCRAVCDMTPNDLTPTFTVACGVGKGADACEATRSYTLTIKPAPVASR